MPSPARPQAPPATQAEHRAELERNRAEREARDLRLVAENRAAREQAQHAAKWVVPAKKRDSPIGSAGARPGSAASTRPSSAGHAYASARSRDEVVARRAERRRPRSAAGAQPGRRTTEWGNFIATGLLNLDNLQIKKSKSTGTVPPVVPGAFAGRDGWVEKPRYKTRSKMNEMRQKALEADPTFDVDGDGTVSNEDFILASKFDVDKDGTIDPEERIELRKAMVQDTVNKLRDFQANGCVGFDPETEELMEAMTTNLEETVRSSAFGPMLQKLQVRSLSPTLFASFWSAFESLLGAVRWGMLALSEVCGCGAGQDERDQHGQLAQHPEAHAAAAEGQSHGRLHDGRRRYAKTFSANDE